MTTKIEWTDKTWNPVTGCTKVSPGCANCYAERMARRLAGRFGYPEAPHHFDVTLHPDRLEQPLRWKKPRRIFVCSMSDLFHKDVPYSFFEEVLSVIDKTPQHIYQILTKRPKRMAELFDDVGYQLSWTFEACFPHVWAGTTVENQEHADKRIPHLLNTSATTRFVSCEPLLGPMRLNEYLPHWCKTCQMWHSSLSCWQDESNPISVMGDKLSWVIVGCESGPKRRPMKLEWAIDLVAQCRAAGVAVFVKQIEINGKVSKDPNEWPTDLQIREFPRRIP